MEWDRVWHLKNFNILEALSKEEIQRLQDMVNTDWIKRRDPIYLQGEPTKWIYFLKEGLVKLSMTSEQGRTITVALLKPGEVFGELALSDQTETNTEAIAIRNSYLCRISRDSFLNFAQRNQGLFLSVNKLLGLRIRRIQTAIKDMIFLDVPSRLAKLLNNLAESDGEKTAEGVLIKLPLTHQEIANLVGATREMVSTVLKRFADDGLVLQRKRRLILPDRNRLARLYSAG